MSTIWRTAVETHALTLNAHLSLLLILLADSADPTGEVRVPDVVTLARYGRCNERDARKAIDTLVESGFLKKTGPRLYRIAETVFSCPQGCQCGFWRIPSPVNAPGTTQQAPDAPKVAPAPSVSVARQHEGPVTVLNGVSHLAIALEVRWRKAFDTEPSPGLMRKTVLSLDICDDPRGAISMSDHTAVSLAFDTYLSRLSDPMFLNLAKFASTWRAYLEPVKGKKGSEAAFDMVFGKIEHARPTAINGDSDL